ncbi:MAG: hypothetical protein HRT47_08545 [Candidatus Caenarcaniphilales bacterium]|nr:hypothetical protein [Candidatus Caenarcaniphilales bacterium]
MSITGTQLNITPRETSTKSNVELKKPLENTANKIVSTGGLNTALARPQSKIQNLIDIAENLPASEIKFTTMKQEDLSKKIRIPQNSNLKAEDLTGNVLKLNGGVEIAEVNEIVGNGGLANIKGEEPFRIESKDYRALVNNIENIAKQKNSATV